MDVPVCETCSHPYDFHVRLLRVGKNRDGSPMAPSKRRGSCKVSMCSCKLMLPNIDYARTPLTRGDVARLHDL